MNDTFCRVKGQSSLFYHIPLLYNVLTAAPMSGCLNDVMKVQKKHVKIDFQSRLPSLFLEVSVTVCTNKKNDRRNEGTGIQKRKSLMHIYQCF